MCHLLTSPMLRANMNPFFRYIESLNILIDAYIKPMRELADSDSEEIFTPSEMSSVFWGVELIMTLNKKFHIELETHVAFRSQANRTVGQLFVDFGHFFKTYGQYAENYQNAKQILDALKESRRKKLQDWEKKVIETHRGCMLQSLLIMPIQRVPRYEMLLKEICAAQVNHRDHGNSETAFTLVKKVNLAINESIRKRESRDKIAVLQDQFRGDIKLLTPSRRFSRDGPVSLLQRRIVPTPDKPTHRMLLFNDLVVIAGSEKNRLTLVAKFKINKLSFVLLTPEMCSYPGVLFMTDVAALAVVTADQAAAQVMISRIRFVLGSSYIVFFHAVLHPLCLVPLFCRPGSQTLRLMLMSTQRCLASASSAQSPWWRKPRLCHLLIAPCSSTALAAKNRSLSTAPRTVRPAADFRARTVFI
jgi:hypothetical protein